MKKILLALAIALLAIVALLAWVFIPTHERIGPQTNEIDLNDEFSISAHRIVSTDPDVGSKFAYFVVSDAVNIEDQEPFLVTSDQFAKVSVTGEQTLQAVVNGRIYQFHNDLWVERENGQLWRWYVSLEANYVR